MVRRLLVVLGGLGAFGTAIAAFVMLSPNQVDAAGDGNSVERSASLLKQSNATAAKAAALDAVRADPNNGQAHLALAQAMLALDDGIGAEGEIQRAVDTGFDAKLVPQYRAHALLLQGDPDRAIAEADKAIPLYRAYALRIRARALTLQGKYADAQAALDEAMRITPRDAALWTDLGRFRYSTGDLRGAVQAVEQAVKLDTGNARALLLRGELVRSQYGLVAALPWFEAALKRDPFLHDALIEYAATLGDSGRTEDSLAATRRALEARPGSPQAFYLQAVIAARAGDDDLARSLMEKTGGALDDVPGVLLLGGTLDIEQGDYEQAIGKLRELVAVQPMNLTARKLLATALLRSDSARNAIDILRPVVARGDADSYTLTLAARGFERIGDRVSAAKLLDRAAYPVTSEAGAFSADDSVAVLDAPAAANPGDPDATVPLIRAMIAQGNQAGALARAQALVRDNPGVPGAQLLLGDMLMLGHSYADAAAAYRLAADLRFDEPTMLRLVEALDRGGHRQDAANVLALFLSQNPVSVAALRLSGSWQLAAGDYDAAIDTLENLRARIGDGDAALNADLAMAYSGAGEDKIALDFGEAAYGLAPGNPAVADAYGWALYQSGDAEGALELLQKAVALAPRHAGLRWHLAQIYADLGRKPDAKAQAQAALADPRFSDRAAAQAMLAS
ncbi:tetratricopeptide repeat protein [Sphingomonas sp. JC676]|nr:tetratricopeptide repeat protein [Sphingomonas sp. JC676]